MPPLSSTRWFASAAVTVAAVAVAIVAMAGITPVRAQSFPDRPVKLVVPFAVGGGTDILARELAPRLGEALGQPVVVDNRGGAGGNIGSALVANAPADGYTVLFGSNSLSINAALYRSLPFDPVKSFAPIGVVATAPLVLVTHPGLKVETVRDLLAMARARPDALNWSAPGSGTPHHLASELFNSMTGVKVTHVQYKGGGPALTDLVAGQTQVGIITYASVRPYLASGRIRALAVTTADRSQLLPDLPTVAESGVPGYAVDLWYGLFAPVATPAPVVRALNAALAKVLADPAVRQRFNDQGYELAPGSPDDLATRLAADLTRSARVVTGARITAE